VDFWQQYRAIDARDVRFDGQFVTAVSSTKIYCRPSCPARTPKPANVTFYRTSAAAHEAGYRACKRCLPEAVPGNPRWNVRSDVSARAMRLIGDGEVDRAGVPGLAAELGYSTRQLNRILRDELGAGALALARAHRAQTARTLLTGSALKAADVAFAAGFGSIRQFNDTVQQVFDLTPRQLRQASTKHSGAAGPRSNGDPVRLSLALPVRQPYDNGIFRFLADRAVDGVELASGSGYERLLGLPGGPAWFRASSVEDHGRGRAALPVTVSVTCLSDLPLLLGRIRRLFDLDADPVAIDTALSRDERFRALVTATPGIRLPGALDPHEILVRALVEEHLPLEAARKALARLAATGPLAEVPGSALRRFFPTPEQLLDASSSLQHPGVPLGALHSIARSLAAGTLDVSIGADTATLRAGLLAHPGISRRTADHVILRVLGDPDVQVRATPGTRTDEPCGPDAERETPPDRATDRRHTGDPDPAADATFAGIRPWRSYASVHLWRTASTGVTRARYTTGAPTSSDHLSPPQETESP
jgi:AraC family transcriptional regulator of adaptative response / DNA-3-methyladenine glycosylase II